MGKNTAARKVVAVVVSVTLVCGLSPAVALAEGPGDEGGFGGLDSTGGGANTQTYDFTGTYSGVIVADGETVSSEGCTYTATSADVNAALSQNGGALTLVDTKLVKGGSDTDGDSCNFYGVNSILLAVGSTSSAVISDSALSATGEGSNGIFSTDSATVYANNVSISTSSDNSRGLDATYSGTIVASSVSIDTQGDHCAGVATDRGGGSVSLTSATIQTAGEGSPVLYSTGDVEVSGITGTATGSQLVGMEGANTVLVNSSTLTSTITGKTASDPVADGIIVYQSTSGDADTSTGDAATLQVVDSTLTSSIQSGSMLYFTNTTAEVLLQNSTLDFDSDAANLILASGNDGSNNWGSAGSNGATVSVTASNEQIQGTIEADEISSVYLCLADGSTWMGTAVISENSSATTSSTVDEPLSVAIDATSAWVVTESCEVSALAVAEGGQVVDEQGQAVAITVDGEVVVEGASSVTVETASYTTDYDESAEVSAQTSLIDRAGFDELFGTSTSFALGDTTATGGADVSDTVGTSGESVDESTGSDGDDGTTDDGTTDDDATDDDTSDDGATDDGTTDDDDSGTDDGTTDDGTTDDDAAGDGTTDDGTSDDDGTTDNDTADDGATDDDASDSDSSSSSSSTLPIYSECVKLSKTSFAYNGKARTPSVTVSVNGAKLKKGTDYTVSWSSSARKAIGTYTVTVTGKGGYTGTVTKTFKIVPGKVTLKSVKAGKKGTKRLTAKWKGLSGGVSYQIAYRAKGSLKWKKATVGSKTYKKVIKGLKSGKKYKVKVRAYKKVSGKTYYGAWSSVKTVKVR